MKTFLVLILALSTVSCAHSNSQKISGEVTKRKLAGSSDVEIKTKIKFFSTEDSVDISSIYFKKHTTKGFLVVVETLDSSYHLAKDQFLLVVFDIKSALALRHELRTTKTLLQCQSNARKLLIGSSKKICIIDEILKLEKD